MKKVIIFFLLATILFLGGCGAGIPLRQTADRTEFTVKVHVVQDDKIGQICAEHGVRQPAETIAACSNFNTTDNVLEMWVVEPAGLNDYLRFKTIGHELWHGVRGNFHAQ